MIDFQQEDRTQQRVIGAAATFAYAALVLLLLLLVRFTLAEPPDTGGSVSSNERERTKSARPAPRLSFTTQPDANTGVFHSTKGLRQGHEHA